MHKNRFNKMSDQQLKVYSGYKDFAKRSAVELWESRLAKAKFTYEQAAKEIGTLAPQLYRWCNFNTEPRQKWFEKIENWLKKENL